MSRYRDSGNFAYRDAGPPPPRWDADRFTRERDYRQDEYYAPAAPPPRRAPRAPVYEEERAYYEDDRYGPAGARMDRRYFEEDEYYDPRIQRGQMVPFRPARPARPEAPPRPGLLRRQSSLDTFDRPMRRYDEYDDYRPPPRPQRINIDVPEPPSPRANRYRPSRPARPAYDHYDERNYYDDVAIQDPDYYGDEGFREYREREWISQRRRDSSGSRSHSRSRPPTEVPAKEAKEVKEEKREVVRKEEIKEEVKEKPYPRRGKTKMPKRLVHTKVLFDLGYPFYEEGEKTIIIEKALGPENIDEVFAKSREYREKEVSTTRLIEAPPPPPPSAPRASKAPSMRAPSVHETFKEDVFKEEVRTIPISQAPRSVREWDQLDLKDDSRTVHSSSRRKSHRSKSRKRSPSPEVTIINRQSTVIEREPSPSPPPRSRRSKSRRRSSFDETEIIERKVVREEEDFGFDESNSIHVGPLALVRESRNDRDLKAQIRQLEAERNALRYERKSDRDLSDFVKIERRGPERSPSPDPEIYMSRRRVERRLPSPSPDREVRIERRGDDVVEIRKDRRERSFSRTRAPSAGLIKSMLYTAT